MQKQFANNISQFSNLAEIEKSLEVSDYHLGRLTDAEKASFEERLGYDKGLQQSLASELEFAKNLTAGEENYTVSEDNFTQFSALLEERDNHLTLDGSNQLSERNNTVSLFFKQNKLFGIAASLVVFMSVALLTSYTIQNNQIIKNQTGFRTLSNDSQFINEQNDVIYQVIFADELTQQDISIAAKKYGFELLKNSSDNSLLLIRFEQPLSSVEQGLLRDTNGILFIEKAVKEN